MRGAGKSLRRSGAGSGKRARLRAGRRFPASASRSRRRSLGGRSPTATCSPRSKGRTRRLKNEWVVISAHPDHNGAVGDTIFHGADDNASGAVALLAIAEAYAKAAAAGQRPRRSVLFASFNSEERGPLMGSWGYTEAPSVPLDRTVAMINMDMIGRNEEVPENGGARFRGLPVQTCESNKNSVTLLGWSRSASLTAAVERANARVRAHAQEELRQQHVAAAAAQRQLAVPAARRAGDLVSQRPASRLSPNERHGGADQLREDGAHREARASAELGSRAERRPPHAEQANYSPSIGTMRILRFAQDDRGWDDAEFFPSSLALLRAGAPLRMTPNGQRTRIGSVTRRTPTPLDIVNLMSPGAVGVNSKS